MFGGPEPFMQFWQRAIWGTFILNYFKVGPVAQEISFKVYGGHRTEA